MPLESDHPQKHDPFLKSSEMQTTGAGYGSGDHKQRQERSGRQSIHAISQERLFLAAYLVCCCVNCNRRIICGCSHYFKDPVTADGRPSHANRDAPRMNDGPQRFGVCWIIPASQRCSPLRAPLRFTACRQMFVRQCLHAMVPRNCRQMRPGYCCRPRASK